MFIISSLFVYAAKIIIFRETAKQDCPFYDKLIYGVIAVIMPKVERLTQEERKRRAEEALRKWG